ncbi:FK506-binding protein 2B [Cymbomonas tetramitiformis]|uniref:peptidylprolyl isomerase n=1 Tax=Cymbomonas tetramitiformis TaxID=36881 RepID=A0AAE0FDJ0_9CHLO|nr:FK506-binding protein 2B [Cymbomonas tetramitiformis]
MDQDNEATEVKPEENVAESPAKAEAADASAKTPADAKAKAEPEKPKYTKRIMKKGDKQNFPLKKQAIKCNYTGRLSDGTQFDSSYNEKKKQHNPLQFKVGIGKVIKGWDEALLTMSVGEKAEITIEPEWAYGKKGMSPKIPPNATLIFEVELVGILG